MRNRKGRHEKCSGINLHRKVEAKAELFSREQNNYDILWNVYF